MAKRKQEEAHENEERWLITYADMITLLMVFFVVMFSMANTDLKKFETIAQSLGTAFNVLGNKPASAIVGADKSSSSNTHSGAAPLVFQSLPPSQRDFLRISTELANAAQKLGIESAIDVNMNMEGIIISVSDALVFEPGSADLKPEAKEVLDKIAELLNSTDNAIRVEGNTDDVPTNNPLYPSNWELSSARAIAIVRYLSEEGAVSPARFSAAGNAEFKPVLPNTTRTNRAANRRADIIMVYPTESKQFSISMPRLNNTNPVTSTTSGG